MSKDVIQGGGKDWFVCPCGFRWEGSTQRAKDLAWRLHGRRCDLAATLVRQGIRLTNNEGSRPIDLWKGKHDIVAHDLANGSMWHVQSVALPSVAARNEPVVEEALASGGPAEARDRAEAMGFLGGAAGEEE